MQRDFHSLRAATKNVPSWAATTQNSEGGGTTKRAPLLRGSGEEGGDICGQSHLGCEIEQFNGESYIVAP